MAKFKISQSNPSKSNIKSNIKSNEAPLLDHLEELRSRLLWALAYWMIGTVIAYQFNDKIIKLLQHPLDGVTKNVRVVTSGLTDGLSVVLSVALWGGFVIALPLMLYQVWRFIEPALTSLERRYAVPFILGAGLSFGLGCLFCFYIILPAAVPFLIGFLPATSGVESQLNIASYITNVLTYLVAFGILFELPMVSFLLTKINLINSQMLSNVRRYAIVVIMILSAIITPTPDPFNLMLMAVPIYMLYELSILISKWAAPRAELSSSLEM